MAKALKKSNPSLVALIQDLEKAARENDAPIWRAVANRLAAPASHWPQVNLSRLEKYMKEGEVVLIPGKLLGSGQVTGKISVAAFKVSSKAREKVAAAGGKVLGLMELVKDNPRGSNVRIMG